MSARGTPPLTPQILEEAAAWFVEFRACSEHRSGSLAGSAREEFVQWLRRSPEHIRAYLEISETYVRLPDSGTVPPSEIDGLIAHVQSRMQQGVVSFDDGIARSVPALPSSAKPRPRRPLAFAASLLLLLGGGVAGYFWIQRGIYATGPAEERTVTLDDASRIELNARTRLRVVYSKHAREIQLLEGQALFQVAKDTRRPFFVHSGLATVRAVGTQFDVYRKESGTTVTVLEGRVAVYSSPLANPTTAPPGDLDSAAVHHDLPTALGRGPFSNASQAPLPSTDHSGTSAEPSDFAPSDSSGSAAIFLSAGEQLTVSREGVLASTPHTANVSAATAWTRGQLEFQETPLSEVAEEFGRASNRTLVIEDEKLRDFRISGVYSSVDPASLILFLRNQPDLEVTDIGTEIEVRARSR